MSCGFPGSWNVKVAPFSASTEEAWVCGAPPWLGISKDIFTGACFGPQPEAAISGRHIAHTNNLRTFIKVPSYLHTALIELLRLGRSHHCQITWIPAQGVHIGEGCELEGGCALVKAD